MPTEYDYERECNEIDKTLDIPYPVGHNWEGLTPRQINEAYKKLKENEKETNSNV